MNVAVIPARGGSRRIPRKNIRPFLGRPVILYTIDAARQSGSFDHIVVSTDDDAVASIAHDAGVDVPFRRPAELSDDYASTHAVTGHALRCLAHESVVPELACCLYATAPFLTPELIRRGLEALCRYDADFAVSIAPFHFPIQRAVRKLDSGFVEPFWPDCMPCRSQDLEPAWHDAGQMYWGKAQAFMDERPLWGENTAGVPVEPDRVQDIDTEADWRIAELKYQVLSKQHISTTNAV
jgi:N-acylneuraminate cytidylyltransferase